MNQDESMFALLTEEEFDQLENQFKLFRGDTVVNNRRPTPSVTQKSTKSPSNTKVNLLVNLC